MNTDYNLYKIFLYLYEEKSISKTANKLYVSQPAISYSLKELESQLGYTLFYRNSKGIEPTEEAKELYGYISTAFNILNEAEDHLKKINNLSIGNIKIGLNPQIGIYNIIKYISKFKKKYPGIKFDIITKPSNEMMEMLENKMLDIVIDALPINSKKSINKLILSQIKNYFVYHKNTSKSIKINSIEDLSKHKLLLPSYDDTTRVKLDEYMETKGIKLESLVEISSADMRINLVRNGLGVGYLSQNIIDNQVDKDDFIIIDIDELPVTDICCVYIDSFLTTASKKFIDLINKEKE